MDYSVHVPNSEEFGRATEAVSQLLWPVKVREEWFSL
jgi:hypothetical protein